MTKAEFLDQFANNAKNVKIRMALNYDAFLKNESIKITEEPISLSKIQTIYVPKYKKHGNFDTSHYLDQANDPEVIPLTIKQVMHDPAKWDLDIESSNMPNIEQLKPLPIATDLKSGRTLLLDSNHTIVNLLGKMDQSLFDAVNLSVVHIVGTNLEDFIPDFKILNRKIA